MRPHELRALRLNRLRLSQNELGRFLELDALDPGRTVRTWESGRAPIPGYVKVATRLELENRRLRRKVERLKRRAK